jgi:thymidylate synthase ThyX
LHASLVFDDQSLFIPESMGKPKDGQLAGTIYENLGELASRICYDSLGTGRTSEKLHEHILDVKNHSIYEHIVFTIGFDLTCTGIRPIEFLKAFANRKGLWFEDARKNGEFEVTVNLRTILEWERHTRGFNNTSITAAFGDVLRKWAHKFVPMIVPDPPTDSLIAPSILQGTYHKYEDLTDDQANITLYLYGSRGFTHEQVRHRFAMSQRSTRYVDEDGSPYIEHPLVTKYLRESPPLEAIPIAEAIQASIAADRHTYRALVEALQKFCMERMGMTDKTAARKQARGASRGYLGNALASDMLFTTNVTGWKWILSQRKNKLADAEIRQVYTPALEALQSSNYGDRFAEFTLVPSPDGLGTVLA